MKIRVINEEVTIKNLNTQATKLVDDEGNISDIEADEAPFDFFSDEAPLDGEGHGLRPDGSDDGLDLDAEFHADLEGEIPADDLGGGELSLDVEVDAELGDEELPLDGEGDLGLGEEEQEEDPDFQGVIRTVTGANLVYKRKTEEGSYEELWVYNVGKSMKTEAKIRRSILAGTDIGPQDVSSEDGEQECETTSVGNVQFLKITGLPN